MDLLVNKLVTYCISNHYVDSSKEEWLRYGFEMRLSTLLVLIPFIALACVSASYTFSLFCNFIYRDRRQSSPLPQHIKPDAGKGHPIQSSDLLHTFLSVSFGGVAYRRRSG